MFLNARSLVRLLRLGQLVPRGWRPRVAALALGAFVLAQVSLGLGGWTSGGPHGGTLGRIVVDPVSGIVYLGPPLISGDDPGAGVILKTTDSGRSWTSLAPQPDSFSRSVLLVVDPIHAGYLLAANYSGIARSVDGGSTWTQVASILVYSGIYFDPSRANVVYAASKSVLYRSLDDGLSWAALHPPIAPGDSFVKFAVTKDGTLLGALSSSLLKSPDGGDSWSSGTLPAASNSFLSLVADPVGPQTSYALTSQGLFRSTDGGSTWSRRGQGVAISLAVDPNDPATLYAGGLTTYYLPETNGGLWKSTDAGITWKQLPAPFPPGVDALYLAIGPASSALWASTLEGGVFQSPDGGASWISIGGGLSGLPVTAIAVDPDTPQTVYAGTRLQSSNYGRLHRSGDAGRDWTLILSRSGAPGYPGSGPAITSLAVDPISPRTVYAAMLSCIPPHPAACGGGVFKTTDRGLSWSLLDPQNFYVPVTAVAIDPADPETLYAATHNPGIPFPNGSASKSTNGGLTWSRVGDTFPRASVTQWLIDPSPPKTVYVASCDAGVFASTDGGLTWTARNQGLTDRCGRSLVKVDGLGQTLFVGTNGGIFQSHDGGMSWAPTGFSAATTALAVDPRDPQTLFAGTFQNGVLQSRDGGQTWVSRNEGLANLTINALVIDSSGGRLHAATDGGVFELTLRRLARTVDPLQ